MTTYILDRNLQPVPVGVFGELYIGGENLARGYLGRPALTAERFVLDPFGSAGGRLYRTGDMCRHRSDGNVDFLSRYAHQVKIRSFRIEMGEIETLLMQHPAMREKAIIVHEDPTGNRRLVAYLVYADPPHHR